MRLVPGRSSSMSVSTLITLGYPGNSFTISKQQHMALSFATNVEPGRTCRCTYFSASSTTPGLGLPGWSFKKFANTSVVFWVITLCGFGDAFGDGH
jgi:hypothetical protein